MSAKLLIFLIYLQHLNADLLNFKAFTSRISISHLYHFTSVTDSTDFVLA